MIFEIYIGDVYLFVQDCQNAKFYTLFVNKLGFIKMGTNRENSIMG